MSKSEREKTLWIPSHFPKSQYYKLFIWNPFLPNLRSVLSTNLDSVPYCMQRRKLMNIQLR